MQLMPWRPMNEVSRTRREMDDLWSRLFGERMMEPAASVWLPSLDVKETDGKIVVTAELPGLTANDIDVSISDDLLTIKGEKKMEEEKKKEEGVYVSERYFGSFQRSIRLPAGVDSEKVKADFKNGVVRIEMPKTENSKTRKIAVQGP